MLTNFYRDLQAWIDAGCPEPNPHFFRKRRGLCANLDAWCEKQHDLSYEQWRVLDLELTSSFQEAGLDICYPFNEGSRMQFREEAYDLAMYENPKRLEWVRNHAQI